MFKDLTIFNGGTITLGGERRIHFVDDIGNFDAFIHSDAQLDGDMYGDVAAHVFVFVSDTTKFAVWNKTG